MTVVVLKVPSLTPWARFDEVIATYILIFWDTIRWDLFGKNTVQQMINLLTDLLSISNSKWTEYTNSGTNRASYFKMDKGVVPVRFEITSTITP